MSTLDSTSTTASNHVSTPAHNSWRPAVLAAARRCLMSLTLAGVSASRGVGGRCSSRTNTQFPGAVDHAAQFVGAAAAATPSTRLSKDAPRPASCARGTASSSARKRRASARYLFHGRGRGGPPGPVAPNGGVFKKPDGTWSADKKNSTLLSSRTTASAPRASRRRSARPWRSSARRPSARSRRRRA